MQKKPAVFARTPSNRTRSLPRRKRGIDCSIISRESGRAFLSEPPAYDPDRLDRASLTVRSGTPRFWHSSPTLAAVSGSQWLRCQPSQWLRRDFAIFQRLRNCRPARGPFAFRLHVARIAGGHPLVIDSAAATQVCDVSHVRDCLSVYRWFRIGIYCDGDGVPTYFYMKVIVLALKFQSFAIWARKERLFTPCKVQARYFELPLYKQVSHKRKILNRQIADLVLRSSS